eukprot:scaffold31284_cov108-Isochrysis_galbana.AAC.6
MGRYRPVHRVTLRKRREPAYREGSTRVTRHGWCGCTVCAFCDARGSTGGAKCAPPVAAASLRTRARASLSARDEPCGTDETAFRCLCDGVVAGEWV